MSKILTDDLVLKRLFEQGIGSVHETDHDDKLDAIKEYYEFSITEDWGNPDIMFYTETTTDGYEVWVATDDDRNPSLTDDVYYYDNDWLEKMPAAMYDGANIYYQDLEEEDYAFQEVVDEVYEDFYNEKMQEIEEELINEGYERETSNETKATA